jgi:hypothetical protein
MNTIPNPVQEYFDSILIFLDLHYLIKKYEILRT